MKSRKEDIQKTIIYLSRNLFEQIDLKKLATIANVSPFHFFKLFKEETQTTPQQFIEKLRMEHAVHLIALNPSIRITKLAFETGYNSPSYFNQAFKRNFKVAPSIYKRKYLNNNNQNKSYPNLGERNLDIGYLPNIWLKTWLIKPLKSDLENWLASNKIPSAIKELYGIFLDAPFHKPMEECRYLIGYMEDDLKRCNYQIESGYFCKINLTRSIDQELETIYQSYNQTIEEGYRIKQPIGIEKMVKEVLFGQVDFNIKRKLFIPIIKKSQDF